jgi:PAS domain S-box-containing protein
MKKNVMSSEELKIWTLASIVENSHDAIYSRDLQMHITTWNKAAEKLFGYKKEEVLGKKFIDFIVPEDKIKEVKLVEKKLKKGIKVNPFDTVRINKSNKRINVSVSVSIIKDSKGKMIGMSSILRDITKKIETELAIQRSEEKAKRLIDSNIVGVIVLASTRIIEANDAFLKIVGYSRKEFEDQKIDWRKITPKEWEPADQYAASQTVQTGVSQPYEKEIFRKDGSLVSVYVGVASLQVDPPQWVCYVWDITEQKLIDKRKDDFIVMASHELKTPVATVKAFAQILNSYNEGRDEKTGEYLAKIDKQVNRLTKIINDLLDVSKIRSGKLSIIKERFDFDYLVNEIVNMHRTLHPEADIKVSGSTNKQVMADVDRIGQVISNLLNNAIKYSPNKKKVDLLLENGGLNVNLTVKDYGIGIEKESQSKIFQNFYRVFDSRRGEYPGLGIGLFVAAEIVRLHKGKIDVESQKGKGSTFKFSIPIR